MLRSLPSLRTINGSGTKNRARKTKNSKKQGTDHGFIQIIPANPVPPTFVVARTSPESPAAPRPPPSVRQTAHHPKQITVVCPQLPSQLPTVPNYPVPNYPLTPCPQLPYKPEWGFHDQYERVPSLYQSTGHAGLHFFHVRLRQYR